MYGNSERAASVPPMMRAPRCCGTAAGTTHRLPPRMNDVKMKAMPEMEDDGNDSDDDVRIDSSMFEMFKACPYVG